MKSKKIKKSISDQIKEKNEKEIELETYEGNDSIVISTGSTLLDLAISGTRIKGGGIPTGIAVEIFGDSSAGKTVLLCEIGGAIQRVGGDLIFNDPEARLNKEFAKIFDLDITEDTIKEPDTVKEIFDCFTDWKPKGNGPYGIIADSIAAASTEAEMKEEKGYDGAKRANDFSIGFRKFTRKLKQKNYLMVFSNQIRDNMNAMPFAKKTKATGGHAPKFYSSLRLEVKRIKKLTETKSIYGKEHKNNYGIVTEVTVEKSSVDKPDRKAEIYIVYDYGIDDVSANLTYIKQNSKHKTYSIDNGETSLGKSLVDAVKNIEDNDLEKELKNETIKLWNKIQRKFKRERKKKKR